MTNVVQAKVCLLGDFAVGKTSLVRRYVEGRFDDRYLSTIGVKISRMNLARQDHTLKLLLWDLAGGEEFRDYEASYLRGTAGALVVCDLTRPESLASCARYQDQLMSINPQAVVVLVANKADLTAERRIGDSELAAANAQLGSVFMLTSAKTGAQVEAAFERLADLLESVT